MLSLAAAAVAALALAAWRQAGRWRDSETLYAHGIPVGRSPRLVTNLAMVYNRRAHEQPEHRRALLDRALALSQQAISLASERALQEPEYRLHRGTILYNRGEHEAAATDLTGFVRERPDDAGGRSNLGLVLIALERHAAAADHLERAARLAPSSAAAWRNLGRALEGSHRAGPARRAYRRAAELAPGDRFVRARLAAPGP